MPDVKNALVLFGELNALLGLAGSYSGFSFLPLKVGRILALLVLTYDTNMNSFKSNCRSQVACTGVEVHLSEDSITLCPCCMAAGTKLPKFSIFGDTM